LVFSGEPVGEVTPEIRAAHRRLEHQDPMQPADGARKLTDFISVRAYRRRELYQLVDRPLGADYIMQLWLSPSGAGGARFEFDRARCDFDERDRAALDLVLPHLRQLHRRARTWRDVDGALTPREGEILAYVAEGRTNGEIAWHLRLSRHTVRKHLENAYEKLGVQTRTAAAAALRRSA
jgi:DNA-binding CsgD family transcriptional regulator